MNKGKLRKSQRVVSTVDLLPEIHVPIMQNFIFCSPGVAANRGDQGADEPAQWALKEHQVKSWFYLLPPIYSFLFHISCPASSPFHHLQCSLFDKCNSLTQVYPIILIPVPCSLFPVPCSLFPVPCSLFPVPCSTNVIHWHQFIT